MNKPVKFISDRPEIDQWIPSLYALAATGYRFTYTSAVTHEQLATNATLASVTRLNAYSCIAYWKED